METTLQKKKFSVAEFLKGDISTLITLVLMVVLFSALNPYFFTVRNLMSIGSYESIQGTMAAGLTVCMLFGGMDVSQFSPWPVCPVCCWASSTPRAATTF